MKRSMGFGAKMYIFFSLPTIISLAILALIMSDVMTSNATEKTYEEISQKCVLFEKKVDSSLETLEVAIYQLAVSDEVTSEDYDAFDTYAQQLIDVLPAITQIYIMDSGGMQVYKSSHPETIGDRSDRVYFQEAIKGKSYFADVIISRSTHKPIVVHAQPIYRNGAVDGVIGTSIDLNFLSDIYKESSSDYSRAEYGYIVDGSGTLIGYPNESYISEMRNLSYLQHVQLALAGETGVGIYSFEDADKLVAYRHSERTRWGIFYQAPQELVMNEVSAQRTLLFVSIVIVLAISLIVIGLGAWYMKKPINSVVKLIQRLRNRQYDHDIKLQKSEFGIIQDELVGMAETIHKAHDKLEVAVVSRTHELQQAMDELVVTKDQLVKANTELAALSLTDALTQIPNRRSLEQHLAHTWPDLSRREASAAVMILDIDHFKLYNDHNGHLQGDECLKAVSSCIRETLRRKGDFLARYGGEEFAVIIHDIDYQNACLMAERIRKAVEDMKYPHSATPDLPVVTISVGMAYVPNCRHAMADPVFEKADEMLYAAKGQGRNQSCFETL